MKVLIIIPAFNEGKIIEQLLRKIKYTCPEYDVMVINDCSRDDTMKVSQKYSDVVNLPVNLGIGGAVQTGYIYALQKGYDAAVQVDGDGQHNPEFIHALIREVEDGENLVIGSRFIEKAGYQSSVMRRVGIRFLTFLIRALTGERITDPTSGFRACNRRVIEIFAKEYPKDYPEPESIVRILKKNMSVKEVPVRMNERLAGKSSITVLKSMYYMVKVTFAVIITAASGEK